MTSNAEKRVSQRFPQNTPVQFALTPQTDSATGHPHPTPKNAIIIDISATGMGIYTTAHISTGDCVYFIKDQPNWQLPAQGKAVWSLKHNDGFRVGLEFIL